MSTNTSRKKVIHPSAKYYFWLYLAGILLTPILIGLVILWQIRKKQNEYKYVISDQSITAEDGTYSQRFDLVSLENVDVKQSWIHGKLNVGELILHKDGAQMSLKGIESPHELQDMLLTVSANLKAMQEKKHPEPVEKVEHHENSDRINYLTGLWQQGLLSDEDYHKERKHFE